MSTKIFILGVCVMLTSTFLWGQNDCKVKKTTIGDAYEGGCKKGYAHGRGTASGDHVYEGNFKNGLPHGKGKYTYENQDYYTGEWKDGLRHGNGKLVKVSQGFDKRNTQLGLWKNDEFIREIVPEVYKIVRRQNVTVLNVNRIDEEPSQIEYSMRNVREVSNFRYLADSGIVDNAGYGRLVVKEPKFPVKVLVEYDVKAKLSNSRNNHVVVEINFESPGHWKVRMGDQ